MRTLLDLLIATCVALVTPAAEILEAEPLARNAVRSVLSVTGRPHRHAAGVRWSPSQLDRDCAGHCRLAVKVMLHGGEMAGEVCRMCARLCDACAEACERHAAHHDHCRVCARARRRYAEECRAMTSA